jgi:hypothetical protein
MTIGKAIGLITIGTILGYGISHSGKATQQDTFISEERLPSPANVVEIKNVITENKTNEIANISVKTNDSNKMNNSVSEEDQQQTGLTLLEKYQELKEKYQQSQEEAFLLGLELAKLYVSETTDNEMAALVPKPFKSLLELFQGKRRDKIYAFHQQEDDFNWGLETQTNISDFFQMHYESTNIELISVICKQGNCEILAIEKQEGAWQRIVKDMYQNSWCKFSSATHTTKANAENLLVIYGFFNK